MPTLNEKIADSLERLREAGDGDPNVLRTTELSRTHLERLLQHGFLKPVMPGWVMVADPTLKVGESTTFFANFWKFLGRYCDERFAGDWTVDAQTSLRLHTGDMSVPRQVVVISPGGNNRIQELAFQTSLFSHRGDASFAVVRDGLRVMPVGVALVRASPTFFTMEQTVAIAALATVGAASEVLEPLIRGGHSVIAGRLATAFRSLRRGRVADEIVSAMTAAGHQVREGDNPLREIPAGLAFERRVTPVAARIRTLWAGMREDVLSVFDNEVPGIQDKASYLAEVDERYVSDAYHSLSIEGYRVTPELIEKVRKSGWNPDLDKDDAKHKDALAAKGYLDCFRAVREGVGAIIDGSAPARMVSDRHFEWYRALFGPMVASGAMAPGGLAGYRRHSIQLQTSRYVPVAWGSLQDAMDAYFECFEAEDDIRVGAVLGHYVFTYIHPFGDGNGRLGRFMMNATLAGGGFPWTVVPVDERGRYLEALNAASLDGDIKPFAALIADLVKREPPPPRSRKAGEEPEYRVEGGVPGPR